MDYQYLIGDLSVELPVKLIMLENMSISQSLNEHGTASIKGIFEEEDLIRLSEKIDTHQCYRIWKKNKVIFCGLPSKVNIQFDNNVYHIHLVLSSMTILLDIEKRRKSFQNVEYDFIDMISKVAENQDCSVYPGKYEASYPMAPLIQYDETDWEFILRLASHINTFVFSEALSNNIDLHIGPDLEQDILLTSDTYTVTKNLQLKGLMNSNRQLLDIDDTLYYEVQSKVNYNLGTTVIFHGERFIITQKKAQLNSDTLIFLYTLQKVATVKCFPFYNKAIKGAGIYGTVIDVVDGHKLKLNLCFDETQEVDEAFPYRFAVPYSCEGNTGWYMMPEKGERVILYVATEDERSAYVTKILHNDVTDKSSLPDTEVKCLSVPEQSEIIISKNDMSLQIADEEKYLWLSDEYGIVIYSNEDIDLIAGENGVLQCNQFNAEADGKITIQNNKSSIIVDKKVHFHSRNNGENPVKIIRNYNYYV